LTVRLFLTLPALTLAAPCDLDPTFGTGGIALADGPGYQLYFASAMAIQPDGKIVVVGEVSSGYSPASSINAGKS
jgi:hypothetical protein